MLNLPFENEVFDGILAIQSLEYIPLKLTHRALREIHRIFKHGDKSEVRDSS